MFVIAMLVSAIAGGQLLVSATAKLSGFDGLVQQIGSRLVACGLIALELLLACWALTGVGWERLLFICLAAFFGLGAMHRTRVVLSRTKETCLCAHPGHVTVWADVASNTLITVCAIFAALYVEARPIWIQIAGALVAGVYFCLWGRAEILRRRARGVQSGEYGFTSPTHQTTSAVNAPLSQSIKAG